MVKKKPQVADADKNISRNLGKRRPYFFKMMFQTLNIGKLRIPPQFVKHISKDLTDSAILEGPFHDRWIVAVNVTRDHVYLEEGWEDFRMHHSLCNNEFLLFRYDGNMHFKVQIFNPTGCERIEPASKQPDTAPIDLKRKYGRLLNDCVASKPYKDSSDRNSPFDRSLGLKNVKDSKKRIEIQKGTPDPPVNEFGSVKIKEEEESQMGNQREAIDLPNKVDRLSRARSSRESVSKVQYDTEPFTSKNPHITIVFSKGCLKSTVLFLPCDFSKAHMPRTKTKMVLRNPEGKAWEVNCCQPPYRASLCGGLAAFIRDNNIKAGDSFIFELIGKKEIQMHHSIGNQV